MGSKNESKEPTEGSLESSDEDVSSNSAREERLECPICWESFNIVENVPYVLWCGHTLCKNCVLGLQRAVVKFPPLPLQLPLFISCPWCNVLSPRLVYKGHVKFPCKNFFLLWMVESLNGETMKSNSAFCGDHPALCQSNSKFPPGSQVSHPSVRRCRFMRYLGSSRINNDHNPMNNYLTVERLHYYLRKYLIFFVHLTAKFPLVLGFLLIVLYAIPASAAILVLYVLITILFALPSFLILYFACPSLHWLVREIVT
ncbi:hypothetical protein NMG60_11006396 [Bertholletia excelsa]